MHLSSPREAVVVVVISTTTTTAAAAAAATTDAIPARGDTFKFLV
jgi:hypothetical protein